MLNISTFQQAFEKLQKDFRQQKFLLAASGGADSMVLANLCQKSGLNFEIAHLNYQLRGEDSDLDQKVVQNFCSENNIKLHLYKVSENEKPENSVQLWARNLRYDFFFKILKEENLDFIVTAHHLNDELETFIINLSRGSGIKGLSGIPANENQILRPLLRFTKEEIYSYAEENNVEFREDLSNQKDDYLRNKIRNQIVPKITDVFPDFLNQFGESLKHLSTVNQFYQSQIEATFQEIFIKGTDDEFTLDKEQLFSKHPTIVVEIIRRLGFSGIEIDKIIQAENGKFFRSNTHEISIKRNEIVCVKRIK